MLGFFTVFRNVIIVLLRQEHGINERKYMGKTSKSNKAQSGTFSISGGPVATYNKGNVDYKLNQELQSVYDYAQNALANASKNSCF